jgi:hypothetical protein
MFGLWGKRRAPRSIDEPDEVYSARGIADEALVRAARGAALPVVVASFYPRSLERIAAALTAAGVSTYPLGAPPPGASPQAVLLNASRVGTERRLDVWIAATPGPVQFLFVEHFPLLGTERTALDLIEELSAEHAHRVRFFVGLDEPLMSAFGGERLVAILGSLGLAKDERITHPLVDRAIVNAQKKLERRIQSPSPADSDTEWFALNARRG